MFLVNGIKCTLRQFNRTDSNNVYDDQNFKEVKIKCCPYDVDQAIKFGIYTIPEATGYYQLPRWVDVREGDQIIFKTNNHETVDTIIKVQDEWIFNRVENYICAVKRA
jgi:hypothetical protein